MVNINDRLISEFLPKYGTDALAVLLVYAKHMNQDRLAWPSKVLVKQLTGIGECKRQKIMATLVKDGFLSIHTERVNNGFGKVKYRVDTDLVLYFCGSLKTIEPEENKGFQEHQPQVSISVPVIVPVEPQKDELSRLYEIILPYLIDNGKWTDAMNLYANSARWKGTNEELEILAFRFCAWMLSEDPVRARNVFSGNVTTALSKFAYWLTDRRSKTPIANETNIKPRGTTQDSGKPQQLSERALKYSSGHWMLR